MAGVWSCKWCGPHPASRSDWCAKGCGRDYNEMTLVEGLRHAASTAEAVECWCGEVHIGEVCGCDHDELSHMPKLDEPLLGGCSFCECEHYEVPDA